MYVRLLRDYAQSSSYWRRCCFIHACSGFLDVFSAKFVQVATRDTEIIFRLCFSHIPLLPSSIRC